ncbi:MAG: hypothetical protein ACTTKY_00070 [Catonella sp.]
MTSGSSLLEKAFDLVKREYDIKEGDVFKLEDDDREYYQKGNKIWCKGHHYNRGEDIEVSDMIIYYLLTENVEVIR